MPETNFANHTNHFDDNLLNEYLDGYFTENQVADLELHIATCSDCAARLDELQIVFSELEALPDIALERDLDIAVVTALQPRWKLSQRWKWGALVQFIAAAMILLITLPKAARAWQPFIDQASTTLLTSFIYVWNTWVTQITTGLATLQLDWSQWWPPSLFSTTQLESIQLLGWPVFIAVVFLFLIGNGLLLRQVTRNGSH
jgi:hypothetical protein